MYKFSPAARCFAVPDAWFTNTIGEHYFDIFDIQKQLCPLVALADRPQFAQRATFNISGIYLNSGTHLRGVLEGDAADYVNTWDVASDLWLPVRFKRIYFAGTDCRGIKIYGQDGNE